MKNLVIGGSGFVGSVLTEKLLERGYDVIVFDNLRFGYYKNISHLPIEFIEGDIQNPQILENHIDQIDTIYFLATVNIIAAEGNYLDCISTNILGLTKILDMIKGRKHIKRFVYTSTSSIYGNGSQITEDSPCDFLNIYATTKYNGECLCRLYENTEKLPLTIIRYTNTYGKNQRPESPYCGVIGRFIEKAIKGESIEINGNGQQLRDFMSVDDTANLTIELSLLETTLGQDINLNTNKSFTIENIAQIIKRITNSESTIVTVTERKIDNIKCRQLKNTKLLNFIDWNFIDIEEGISRTINWYKNNYKDEI